MTQQWNRRLGWIVVTVIAADWLTKFLVLNRMALHQQVAVLENLLYLVHRQNRGIAFGIMNEGMIHWRLPLLLALGAVATVMLVRLAGTVRDARSSAGLGLVLGGAIGNLSDRALNGAVTDFILVSFFPFIFNVADVALTLGAILLGIGLLRERKPPTWLALAALMALLPMQAQPLRAQQAPAELIVVKSGTATVTPDRAVIVLEVRTEAATPPQAAADNAPVMQRVLAALRALGHPARSINTLGYSVQPMYRYEAGGQTLTGYAAFNAVTVRLDDVAQVGPTLDAGLAAGATRVASVRFEASGLEAARRQAMERAVAGARADAEVLARAAGGRLGELLELSTEPRTSREDFTVAAASMPPAARVYGETPINAGEQVVTVTVRGRWLYAKP